MKNAKVLLALLAVLFLGYLCFTPSGHETFNNYTHSLKKADDKTSYQTRKKVEDTLRASIASYEADKATYEQYKDSESALEKSWANSARDRANRTASKYNNNYLKNSYVFEDNIPADIYSELPMIK